MYTIVLWALVGLIGRVQCKCSVASITDKERPVAYACVHAEPNDLDEISSEAEWIEFSVTRFREIPDDAFGKFRNLKRLSFYNCHVNFISPDAFRGLDHLEWLVFHGTKIHVARATWFRYLSSLRKLIFDRCGLIHIEADLFRMLPRLETLGLRDNDLDCLPTEDLSAVRTLRTVRIDGNPWLCECRRRLHRFFGERSIVEEAETKEGAGREKGKTEVDASRNFQCMTQLELAVSPTDHHHPSVSDWRVFEKQYATIGANEFEASVLASLDRLPDKTSWIAVSGLTIHTIPRYAFFRFGNSLKSLDLRDCSVTVVEPDSLAGLHKLERLSLVGNKLATVKADWFRDLVGLRQLVLRRNGISHVERAAFRHLGDSLRHLDLRQNRLQCVAFENLANLRKLERFDADGNPWSCTCLATLNKYLMERNVGFKITDGRCYTNEKLIPAYVDSAGREHEHEHEHEHEKNGRVQWGSFAETVKNLTISVHPHATSGPATTAPQRSQSTPLPPDLGGTCLADSNDRDGSNETYTCAGLTSIAALNGIPSRVRVVRIILSNLREIPAGAFARFDGYLRALELRDCGIERLERGSLDGLYNLEYLSLRGNHLQSVSSESLRGVSRLKYLDLSRNRLDRITNDAFDAVPYLTSLDISENSMACIGIEHMKRRLAYLRTLTVEKNPWSCLCGAKLANWLDELGIPYSRSFLTDSSEECYGQRVRLPPMVVTVSTAAAAATTSDRYGPTVEPGLGVADSRTTVVTPGSWTTEQATIAIEGVCTAHEEERSGVVAYRCSGANLPLIRTLPAASVVAIELYEGNLARIPAATFSRFRNLRRLAIRNSAVASIEAGAFNGSDRLESLTIQDNPLTTVEESWLVDPVNVERLDLRGNSIRYISPGAFRHLGKLRYLNLEGNDLKCIFTSDLNDLPEVQVMEFSGNPLRWRCRVELEQFLEARKIEFVRISEDSCEGRKIVRNLLLRNSSASQDEDCTDRCISATGASGASGASGTEGSSLLGRSIILLTVTRFFTARIINTGT